MISVYYVYYNKRGNQCFKLISDHATSLQEARYIGINQLYEWGKLQREDPAKPLITRQWIDKEHNLWLDYGSWSEFLKFTGVTVEDIAND